MNSVSSVGSNITISDSLTAMEDFPGFWPGDVELDENVTDPFQGIFYHIMPLQDSIFLFYNKPLFNTILTVLSKQFKCPPEETKKFSVKTHVDSKKCNLSIDKDVMSICANGPRHVSWKEKSFKKLAENLFISFVKETSTLLKTDSDRMCLGFKVLHKLINH